MGKGILSISKSSVVRKIVPGLAWIIVGTVNLQTFRQSTNRIADLTVSFLLISLLIIMIYGLVKKSESSDELVDEHEARSKIFSFTVTFLICVFGIMLQDIPFFEFSIPVKSVLAFIVGIMHLLQGISFLVYERIDSSNPPDDIFSIAAEAE